MSKQPFINLRLAYFIYMIVITPFVIFAEQWKAASGGGLLYLISATSYLLVMQWLSFFIERKWNERKST